MFVIIFGPWPRIGTENKKETEVYQACNVLRHFKSPLLNVTLTPSSVAKTELDLYTLRLAPARLGLLFFSYRDLILDFTKWKREK